VLHWRVTDFQPSSLTAGFGSVWAADYRWPVLVRIDPATRRGEIFASFPASDAAAAGPDWQPGPAAIAAGAGAVWLALPDRRQVLRVAPASRELLVIDLPFGAAEIAAGPDGIFAVSPPGDGRLAAVSPAGQVTIAPVGRSLQLVAAAGRLAWTVDDAAAAVIAVDAGTLAPVATFPHLAGPGALVARGDLAWYACTREIEIHGADGSTERAALWPGGPVIDLLRLDAATGEQATLGQLGGDIAVLAGDGLWVGGPIADPADESADDPADDPADEPGDDAGAQDPVTSLRHYDLAGALLSSLSLPGQIDELAVCGSQLWVSGFRRSRQADVLTVLDADGTLAGEADLDGVDITPWYTPPEPPVHYRPGEFAELARAAVEAALTGPRQSVSRFGDTGLEPPVNAAFSLAETGLRSSPDGYEITVTFRWEGEDDLLGFACPVEQDDDWPATPEEAGGAVCSYLEENLMASAYGVQNAARETDDRVTWLHWEAPAGSAPE
jgi:hypothetical protein